MVEGEANNPPPEDDPLVGKVLDGRFAVLETIGSGGMGKVYKAIQKPLDRVVALKILNQRYGGGKDPGFKKRFFLEASMTSKLSHPNTITVHDYGETTDGILYIAMEFVEGVPLSDLINQSGALAGPRALYIASQICRSLREAHKIGIIHRDLKPANVMILNEETDHDRVKVLDFGLVKSFLPEKEGQNVDETALTQAGVVMGSPLYMAPEQARAHADPRSDIYSLGVVLFQMLTGRPPFQSKDSIDVIVKHLNEVPPSLKTVRPDLDFPPEIEGLVAKMLEKKPENRFQSMDEVLEALRAAGANTGYSGMFSAPRGFSNPNAAVVPPPLPTSGDTKASTGMLSEPVDISVQQPASPKRRLAMGLGLFGGALLLGAGIVWFVTRAPEKPVEQNVVKSTPPVVIPDQPKKVETPPPPKTPPPVMFVVDSEPSGASVFRGEKLIGQTPFSFSEPAGSGGRASAELTFVLDGYLKETTTASGEGPEVRVREKLKKKPSSGGKKRPQGGYKDDPYQ